jgi:uncharacterized membrane protein
MSQNQAMRFSLFAIAALRTVMAGRRTIGNRIAPPRFILFFFLLAAGSAVAWPILDPAAAIMAGFDLAATGFLLSSIPLFRHEADDMRRSARENDANRAVLLALSVILSLVILVAVAGELAGSRQMSPLETALVITTLFLAWTFANFVYALHYAHLFYSGADGGKDQAGLDFPGKLPEPDYWDFIYFSFTLGVALQTSDVCITSPGIRRVVTLHCIEAFVYNLGVLALAINVLAG